MIHFGNLQKTNSLLFFGFLIITGLYFGSSFFIPLTFAIFFTTLMLPLCKFLERKLKFGDVLASFISTVILFIAIVGLAFILFRQLTFLLDDVIQGKESVLKFIESLQLRIFEITGLSFTEQENMLEKRLSGFLEGVQSYLYDFISGFSSMLMGLLLTMVYVFFLLLNRHKMFQFLMKYIPEERRSKTEEIISQSADVAHKYLWGRIQVMFLLGILYTITFLAYGLDYALLLILFGVLITIIPYLGPLISGVLPVLFMAVLSDNTAAIISFAIIVLIIQLIESYVFEPVIIGAEVKQSPLFVIIAIVLGGAIWGFAGLVLFVPIFAILKIIFDHTPGLQPVGFLIGYERPGAKENFIEKMMKKIKG